LHTKDFSDQSAISKWACFEKEYAWLFSLGSSSHSKEQGKDLAEGKKLANHQ
jgi:hypothetical protein|tara:strand:+ start:2180 stop:2335 length:156 start_codon:yes stop_codon:yes gene_type:complete